MIDVINDLKISIIREWKYFDSEWYVSEYPDVKWSGLDPAYHYLWIGARIGRRPSADFSRFNGNYIGVDDLIRKIEVGDFHGQPNSGSAQVHPNEFVVQSLDGGDRVESDFGVNQEFEGVFDANWYLETYVDVAHAGIEPFAHYMDSGWKEGRNPHPLFNTRWYLGTYDDVREGGVNPLRHYVEYGAAELRNPGPDFEAEYYVALHPEAEANPLAFHTRYGVHQQWLTRPVVDIETYLPRLVKGHLPPDNVTVDVIVPVYRGLDETRRCLETVLADMDRPSGDIIVIDDCSPEPELSAWLDSVAAAGKIKLLRNVKNLGFVGTVNRGMSASGRNDVVLLNSDTEVPRGWLRRMMAHAYAEPKIASVTPFSNNATICSYPTIAGGSLPTGFTLSELDAACVSANCLRTVDIPTAVGFAMYIRRDCLDEVGLFDAEAFGRGYGEENDFCMRSMAAGWRHVLACDTFVYHAGEVSFGKNSPERAKAWDILVGRHPHYPKMVARHVARAPAVPAIFATTAALFHASRRPTILMVMHHLGGGTQRHVDMLVQASQGMANVFQLTPNGSEVELSVPSIEGHPTLRLPSEKLGDLVRLLKAAGVTRVHVHHTIGVHMDLRTLIDSLAVPFDFTVHDYFSICPRVNLLPSPDAPWCAEPEPADCNRCISRAPANGAADITSWRDAHRWLLSEADRVICPSEDVKRRMQRYVDTANYIVVLHEPVISSDWPIHVPGLGRSERLRIAVLGTLALHKGRRAFEACVTSADPARYEFMLIGSPDGGSFAPEVAALARATGVYDDAELSELIEELDPHVLWFPQTWPETYSYTLSAAINSGRPIVASKLGAFSERLAGRAHTWIVENPSCSTAEWFEVFESVGNALRSGVKPRMNNARPLVSPFYPDAWLAASPNT